MNDVPRLDTRVVEEFFSRTATTRFIPPCLKHSCHSDRCANFSFPPPSFYRDQIRPVNFPLLSVRLSTTNLKMSQLGVARIRKFVLRWKKKKKKKTYPRNYYRAMHPTFNDKHNKNPSKNSLRYVSEGNNPKLCHSFYFFLG